MPRQLPWVKPAVKHRPRPTKPSKVASDIDDDFFDGTVLSIDRKGKGRAVSPGDQSDSDSHVARNARKRRALSSSPPLPELSAPRAESMRGATSRFELRDDEWMMVEDELLDTAKLFTRHLHIAEYERIKRGIEEKKRELDSKQTAIRPVIVGATFSAEGAMQEKARVQDEKQRRAFHDVFAHQDETYEFPATAPKNAVEGSLVARNTGDTDSEDLDAPPRPQRFIAPRHTALNFTSSVPPTSQISNSTKPPPTKAHPVAPKIQSRANNLSAQRTTPFDMLDEYLPGSNRLTAAATREKDKDPLISTTGASPRGMMNEKLLRASATRRKSRQSMQLLDEWDDGKQGNNEVSKGALDGFGNGKNERERKGSGKHKNTRLDDVPTFLL